MNTTAEGFNTIDFRDLSLHHHSDACVRTSISVSCSLGGAFTHLNLKNEVAFLKNIFQTMLKHTLKT